MPSIAIVYYSAQGHTQQLAEAIAEGLRLGPPASIELLRIEGDDIQNGRYKNDALMAKLNTADLIVFGTPTYMGGYAAQFKAFIDAASAAWFQGLWKDKLAAGFTHSLGLSGDKLNTLAGLFINAQQHGMLWVGTGMMPEGSQPWNVNRISSYSGLMAQTDMNVDALNAGDRETAVRFGKRLAEVTARWTK
jgi:NAD(P)H dehydrogenase (quinone)